MQIETPNIAALLTPGGWIEAAPDTILDLVLIGLPGLPGKSATYIVETIDGTVYVPVAGVFGYRAVATTAQPLVGVYTGPA